MTIKTLAIPSAFLFLSALFLWIIIHNSKGKWWIKAGAMISFSAFSFLTWSALESYRGWPTADSPPETFVFIWAIVLEPNPKTQDPGLIYIWMQYPKIKKLDSPLSYDPSVEEPRAHIFPYLRGLHEQIEKAKLMIAAGQPVFFKKGGGRGSGDGENGPPGTTEGGGSDNQEGEYKIYDLPPSYQIPKN